MTIKKKSTKMKYNFINTFKHIKYVFIKIKMSQALLILQIFKIIISIECTIKDPFKEVSACFQGFQIGRMIFKIKIFFRQDFK